MKQIYQNFIFNGDLTKDIVVITTSYNIISKQYITRKRTVNLKSVWLSSPMTIIKETEDETVAVAVHKEEVKKCTCT